MNATRAQKSPRGRGLIKADDRAGRPYLLLRGGAVDLEIVELAAVTHIAVLQTRQVFPGLRQILHGDCTQNSLFLNRSTFV